jgi:hypothetical protein
VSRRGAGRRPVASFYRPGLECSDRETPTATYAELQAFRAKAIEMGLSSLATAALIGWEWLQHSYLGQRSSIVSPLVTSGGISLRSREPGPIFVLVLRAESRVLDPIKSLRAALKLLGRRFGLRVVSIREQTDERKAA